MNNLFKIAMIAFISVLMACSQGNPVYVANIQSLQDSLAKNKQNLSFDISPFELRADEINKNLARLKTDLKDTLTLEDGNTFDKYKGVMKIYKRNISLYSDCQEEQISLEKQIKNLLKDVKNNKYEEAEFNTYFTTEKNDIMELIRETNQIKSSIYEVEPEFRRLSDIIYTKLETIKD